MFHQRLGYYLQKEIEVVKEHREKSLRRPVQKGLVCYGHRVLHSVLLYVIQSVIHLVCVPVVTVVYGLRHLVLYRME